jgi:hypothetical protein
MEEPLHMPSNMPSQSDLLLQPRSSREIVDLLLSHVYVDLSDRRFEVVWGGTSAFADIAWTTTSQTARIRLNREIRSWPEPAVIGLLAHELSHPAQKQSRTTERSTDSDVVNRGLGVYLAVERLVADQYEDTRFRRGDDMYLGYRTVRSILMRQEKKELDELLRRLNLAPKRSLPRAILTHDMVLRLGTDSSVLTIEGRRIKGPSVSPRANIKLVVRNRHVLVYADETLVSRLDAEEFGL